MKLVKQLLNRSWMPYFLFFLTMVVFNINPRYIGSGDTIPSELLPISIIYEHDLDFNEFSSLSGYWFIEIDSKIISTYSIIPGLLNLPVYTMADLFGWDIFQNRQLLSLVSASIISSISVVFMYLALTQVCKGSTALYFALIYAFGTCIFSVASRAMWQHGPSVLFITMSLFILLKKNHNHIPLAGFLLSLAVVNRPTNILITMPLTLYVFYNHKHYICKYILLASIPVFFLCLYSHEYCGSMVKMGQIHPSYRITKFKGDFLVGLVGLLVSPARGLFVFSPIFIFSFSYLIHILISRKTNLIYKYLAIATISLILLYSKWFSWWGGHCFGYRLLIELCPLLCLFMGICWEKIIVHHKYLKVIFICLVVVSIYFQYLGAHYYPSDFNWVPNNIDHNTERLWDIKDTELVRCTKAFLQDLREISI